MDEFLYSNYKQEVASFFGLSRKTLMHFCIFLSILPRLSTPSNKPDQWLSSQAMNSSVASVTAQKAGEPGLELKF
jgi:hypothetical protein